MGPAVFVIAIMGCGEAQAPCDQVRMLDTQYQSVQACTAATPVAVTRHGDIDYPVVVAQCMAANEAAKRLMPSEVKLPEVEAAS